MCHLAHRPTRPIFRSCRSTRISAPPWPMPWRVSRFPIFRKWAAFFLPWMRRLRRLPMVARRPVRRSMVPPHACKSNDMRFTSLVKWTLVMASALAWLCLVFGLYSAGQALWAVLLLALGGLLGYLYGSGRTLAWRYLFPGVAGMFLFVAFPLLYTVQIGFTNYSASNLLSQERARAYLLEQSTVDEDQSLPFSLHPEGAV